MIDNSNTAFEALKVQDLLKKVRYEGFSFWMLDLTQLQWSMTGNKAFKLAYNLQHVQQEGYEGLLTFGGAYSNHIDQSAQAAQIHGIPSIGMIRGSIDDPDNPTLSAAKAAGMQLISVSRTDYRLKDTPDYLTQLQSAYTNYWIIPEGGSNAQAIKGTTFLGSQIRQIVRDHDISKVALPVGTGGTMAGIVNGIAQEAEVIGYSALKNANQEKEMDQWLDDTTKDHWRIVEEDVWGGFAKWDAALVDFIKSFYAETAIPLDILYVGKMLCHAYQNKLLTDDVLYIHTGGIQGNRGFNQRFDLGLPIG